MVQAALFEPLAALGEESLAAARAAATPEQAAALELWLQAMTPELAAPARLPGSEPELVGPAAPAVVPVAAASGQPASSGFRTDRATPPPVARRPVGKTGPLSR